MGIMCIPRPTVWKWLNKQGLHAERKKSKQELHRAEIEDLIRQGKTLPEISANFGLRRTELWTFLKKNKITYTKVTDDLDDLTRNRIRTAIQENLALRDKRLTVEDLADAIDVTPYAVRTVATQYGIKLQRPRYDFDALTSVCAELGFEIVDVPSVRLDSTGVFKCHCGNVFTSWMGNIFRQRTQSCGCVKSRAQAELYSNIVSWFPSAKNNDKSLLRKLELDIIVPEKKFAIEYTGLYFHSIEALRSRTPPPEYPRLYHYLKMKACADLGWQLVTIFEDEWRSRPQVVLSVLRAKLGISSVKLFARKCKITTDTLALKIFIEANHLQGDGGGTYVGLRYGDQIVAGMSFYRNTRLSKEGWELNRFCVAQDTSVVGAFSRLMAWFIQNHCPTEIISLSDSRWSNGGVYKTNGFAQIRFTKADYFYLVRGTEGYFMRRHKSNYRLDRLKKMGWYEEGLSESQITAKHGLLRIYDCGKVTWRWCSNNPSVFRDLNKRRNLRG
jgi:hypothetical protein